MTGRYDDAIKDAKASLATWPEWLKIPEKRGHKMTDKMLSAEKVAIVLDGLDIAIDGHPSKKFREGGARVVKHIRAELLSGQLDADCPKCLRCRDTGVKTIHGDLGGPSFKVACDCPAGTGGSEK